MYKLILSVLLSLFTTIGLTQSETTSEKPNPQAIAKKNVQQMKKSILLVRLKTKEHTLAAMRRAGNTEKADKVEAKLAEENQKIISAFKTDFDFCPTYFFYSTYSDDVLNGKLENVIFLNDSLQPDSSITVINKPFFTAEFGIIEQDTAKYEDGYYYVEGKNGLEKRTTYSGAASMTFGALIIKNNQFFQLRKPFPYYSRTLRTLPIKRKTTLVVRRMNTQLHNFHGRVQ